VNIRHLFRIVGLVCLIACTGCGGGPVAGPVNAGLARETLRTTLDAWKEGRAIDTLVNQSPSIVAQDFDWMAGAKLESYEFANEGVPQDANLRVPVRLKLKDKGLKSVNYIVGTDIRLTVFRAME